ncbi:MAG: type II secretion system F family protein [Candidatus Polarisedimenticolaceae bacterium]|nr:type II secretion system F family protein [Candidatus Polarisedimenticolaceae bacterium]
MKNFYYKALNKKGDLLEGEMEAASQNAVIKRLNEMGHLPIEATPQSDGRPRKKQHSFLQKNEISRDQLLVITRSLSRMIGAGVTLARALETLAELSETEGERELLQTILGDIQAGKTFASAIEARGAPFNRLYINMVKAGEASGALDTVLERLSDYLTRSAELRSDVISALIYPAILFFVSILSLVLLLTMVVPQFQDMFDDAGATLPYATTVVIGLSKWLQAYWWLLLMSALALLTLTPRLYEIPGPRLYIDQLLLQLPGIGNLITKIETARFCRTLSTLLDNGVIMLSALTIVRETMSNHAMSASVRVIESSLKAGEGLSRPLQKSTLFPPLAAQMIHVGEESGRLEAMLMDVANIYDQEVKDSLKRLLLLLEPLLILTLGIMIAGIIVSILMAMLSLNELAF